MAQHQVEGGHQGLRGRGPRRGALRGLQEGQSLPLEAPAAWAVVVGVTEKKGK